MQNTTETPVPGNAFPQLLAMLEEGEIQNDASRRLTSLVERVTQLGKAGKLILTLTVEPAGRGNAVNFDAELQVKEPKSPKNQTLLFVDPDKGYVLTKDNPKQKSFAFAEVPRPAAVEVKTVETTMGEIKTAVNS